MSSTKAQTPKSTPAQTNQPSAQKQDQGALEQRPRQNRQNNQGYRNNQNNERRTRSDNVNGGDRPNSQRRRTDNASGNVDRRKMGPRTPRQVPPNCRTLYVNRVYSREFEGHNLSEQYKEIRFQYLKSLFEVFGAIEHVENNIDRNSVTISFVDHDSAARALETLKQNDKKTEAVEKIQQKLAANKLPSSLAPNTRFYVDWEISRNNREAKNTEGPRTVYASAAQAGAASSSASSAPKNVIAQPRSASSAPASAAPAAASPTPAPASEDEKLNGTGAKDKKVKKDKQVKKEETQQPAQPQIGAETLRRQAEKAKLKDELEYFKGHTSRLQQQITAEKERCTARDGNIVKLREELDRIRSETARIEEKLKNETEWKSTAEQRVVALDQELHHFVKEQERAESRLKEFLTNETNQ